MRPLGTSLRSLLVALLAVPVVIGGLAAPGDALPRRDGARTAEPDPLADVRVEHWGGQLEGAGVLAHAPSGRIMVFADDSDLGRFVHFGFGRATASGGCEVSRWVVLDQEDNRHAWLYDAHWQPVDFTPLHLWGQFLQDDYWMHYLRLETAPDSFATDCAKVSGHAHRAPGSRRVGPLLSGDLGPMTDVGRHPTTLLQVPATFPYDADSELHYSVEARPDAALWEELVTPPVPVDVVPELPPGSDLALAQPVPPQTLDLWTYDAPLTGTLMVRPTSLYTVRPRIRVTADGLSLGEDGVASYDQLTRRVTVAAPTDWTGTLAGQTLWGRAPDKWHQPYHAVLTFLDDSWVYLSDQAADPVPASCDTVDAKLREGCHRYYYDQASGRLQLDDTRLEPTTAGWLLPWEPDPVRAGSSTAPVPAGTRLGYVGEGASFGCLPLRAAARGCAVSDVELRLHRDGTYRFSKTSSLDGITRQHHGTYEFTGTALVLDPAKYPPVTLTGVIGYWQGGKLRDLDWSVAGVYGAAG
ncbi:MAG TPA: hypothetical protein VNS55_10340 [Nocardioides sp.]|nr:hypothetical protein [Nocardioides sp.]